MRHSRLKELVFVRPLFSLTARLHALPQPPKFKLPLPLSFALGPDKRSRQTLFIGLQFRAGDLDCVLFNLRGGVGQHDDTVGLRDVVDDGPVPL